MLTISVGESRGSNLCHVLSCRTLGTISGQSYDAAIVLFILRISTGPTKRHKDEPVVKQAAQTNLRTQPAPLQPPRLSTALTGYALGVSVVLCSRYVVSRRSALLLGCVWTRRDPQSRTRGVREAERYEVRASVFTVTILTVTVKASPSKSNRA